VYEVQSVNRQLDKVIKYIKTKEFKSFNISIIFLPELGLDACEKESALPQRIEEEARH
jgi:hypothetical protein